jgi:uncharacterized membrane protein YfcA
MPHMELTFWLGLSLLLVGLGIGGISGTIGVGGALLVIPVLTAFYAVPQKSAQGISLGMLTLVFIGFWQYYRSEPIDWRWVAILAVGYAIGTSLGALLATRPWMQVTTLRTMYAVLLVYIAGLMLFRQERTIWAMMCAGAFVAGVLALRTLLQLIGRKLDAKVSFIDEYAKRRGIVRETAGGE